MALAPTGRVFAQAQATTTPPASEILTEVTVTASRVAREGYDAPTPTTVLGDDDIRAAARVTIGEMLADQPQFRAAGTPALTNGSTNSSASVVDLRGLGFERTLVLINGHRFIGSFDLNTVPQSIIKRVDVVTGGASAAWGSGAVAGVVNMIVDDDLDGLTAGLTSGISSHDDAERFGGDLTYGTTFADGRGHLLFAAEYFRDQGIFGRDSGERPNLDSSLFGTDDGRLILARDVNSTVVAPGGVIVSGALTGMQFNPDGSLSPIPRGSVSNSNSTIGGGGKSGGDYQLIASPYHRSNAYGRATFEVSDALTLSFDLSYTKLWDDFLSFPEETYPSYEFQKDNPFLTPAVQAQLASGPQTFSLGRIFGDPEGFETLKYNRRTVESSIGASGRIGGGWSYDAYFNYGEIRQSQGFYNQRIEANFQQAIDAVRDPSSGNIVCRVALTNPNTPCRPLNLFGRGNASQEAINFSYANADQVNLTNTRSLAATGASIHGDPFSTWAGPVSVAFGADYRKEKLVTDYLDPLSASGALGSFNNSGVDGSFDVKETFFETVVPVLDAADAAKIDLNGAARYSDYNTSGGIWSWKLGATARLVDDVLLRTVYSRDIRSPNIRELFTSNSQSNFTIIDPLNNNELVTVPIFSGGNTSLTPETSNTLTLGATYSPHFVPGLSMSVDYYRIRIRDAIARFTAQDIVNLCADGNTTACNQVTRDSDNDITRIDNTFINLSSYETAGPDVDISYSMPVSNGTLRVRSFTNYVSKLIINDAVTAPYDRAGDVGDIISFSVPKLRSVQTISYDSERFGVDARIRYVGGGNYDSQSPIENNRISSRTYFDLGAYLNIADRVTVMANVQNLFDREPPFVIYATPHYDVMGRYMSLSLKVRM